MTPFIHVIEFAAVLSAGTYGILLARSKEMDFIGVFSVASIIAFGGGTLRDLFLDRHPLFWIKSEEFPLSIFALALITSFITRLPRWIRRSLAIPDALGLGFFSILGTTFALDAGTSWFVASLLGVITGTFGGVIGEVICNEVPSLFTTAPLYATCAFAGSWIYLGLQGWTDLSHSAAVITGVVSIVCFRLLAIQLDWKLPRHGLH